MQKDDGRGGPSHVICAPYGTWESPLTAKLLAARALELAQLMTCGEEVYWVERRPGAGHGVLVRRSPTGDVEDVTRGCDDVRSRVHTYGGPAVAVGGGGLIAFVEGSDQQLYAVESGHAPRRLTPGDARRYVSPLVDARRDRVVAVCEDHRESGEPACAIVAVPLEGGEPTPLATGRDFFAAPIRKRTASAGRTVATTLRKVG